jgi:hypothetical protein
MPVVQAITANNTGKPEALCDDTVPLLQFHMSHMMLGEYYLICIAHKEDLLAHRFDRVTAHVQFDIP